MLANFSDGFGNILTVIKILIVVDVNSRFVNIFILQRKLLLLVKE